MFCKNCGAQQQEGVRFCTSCGYDMTTEVFGRIMPPEQGLTWSLCLTPIAGSIFWSKNWKRLGKSQHIWWTWVTGMVVMVLSIGSRGLFHTQVVGTLLYLAWVFGLYGLQRKEIPKEIRSVPNQVVSLILTVLTILSLFLLPKLNVPTAQGPGPLNNNSTSSNSSADQATTAPAPAPSSSDSSSSSDNSSNSATWNKQDLDVTKNGNIAVAIQVLSSAGDLTATATSPAPNSIFKAPWNYYGQVVKITGQAAIVQEYPPDSNVSKNMGGSASEIVLESDDSTVTDFLLKGTTGNLQVGDTVTVYGYPCGQVAAPNKLGGTTQELAVVGNAIDQGQ